MAAIFTFNLLSAGGTALFFSFLFSIPVTGASIGTAIGVMGDTLNKLKWPVVTIALVLGLAFDLNFSGMAVTLGLAFAATGALFPFFSPFLGWLGVFMTGSDTSSNALFGQLQHVTANKLGIDPIVTVSANSTGGVCGKMISPQSLSVATAATNMVGREGDIFAFTIKHSLILTAVIGVMTCLQAYVIKAWVPTYLKAAVAGIPAAAKAAATTASNGTLYLVGTFVVASILSILVIAVGKKLTVKEGSDTMHLH